MLMFLFTEFITNQAKHLCFQTACNIMTSRFFSTECASRTSLQSED